MTLRACLHEGGGPHVGEVTWGGLPHLTCKRDHIKMRDYMDRRVTPPKRVTSLLWGTPPSCKQALSQSKKRANSDVHKFSRASCQLQLFVLNSYWFLGLSSRVVIGWCNKPI